MYGPQTLKRKLEIALFLPMLPKKKENNRKRAAT
jgi:hypothetical protein